MIYLRPGRLATAATLSSFLVMFAGASSAATQVLVGVTSVRFAWAPASGQPTGYLVSRSLNLGAYQTYASTVDPEIEIPVKAGDKVSIRVAATGYDSAGVYRVGPTSTSSDQISVVASPVFPVTGSWLLRCSSCNTMATRSLANASLTLAQAPGLAAPWRVLGVAQLQYARDQIIWHNSSTGRFALHDGQFLAPIAVSSDSGPTALRGVGVADFDRDGMEEFLAQRTDNGDVMAWAIDSGRFKLIATISHPSDARLVAVGDFDRNGRDDLLWHDPVARTLDLWLLKGDPTLSYPLASVILRTVRVASGLAVDASAAATGDYNGDRYIDVLWRYGDGRLAITYLASGAVLAHVSLTPVAGDVNRRVIGAVDIGGTAGEEVALQDNVTGLITILDPATNGSTTRTSVVHPGAEWRVVGIGW